MQYTSKFALIAAEEYDIEAREVESDLTAREFYDMYLEARADPSIDARSLDAMDLEAREYLEYLEARESAVVVSSTRRCSPLLADHVLSVDVPSST
jgi:hypothetical protein